MEELNAELRHSLQRVMAKLTGNEHALTPELRNALTDQDVLVDLVKADLKERGVIGNPEYDDAILTTALEILREDIEDEDGE
jgi:hypothetical protein